MRKMVRKMGKLKVTFYFFNRLIIYFIHYEIHHKSFVQETH